MINNDTKNNKDTLSKEEWYDKYKKTIENYDKVMNSQYLKLLKDINRDDTRTYTLLDKQRVRMYLKNPLTYKNALREVSQFLYRVSYEYKRIIWYLAGMFIPECHSIIPNEKIESDTDKEVILENYNATLNELKKFDLKGSFFKALLIAWREDVVYCLWLENENHVLIEPFNGQYGKIVGVNYDNTLVWAMDMSYFQRRQEILPTYGKTIEEMYHRYEENINMRWQIVPPEVGFAIKINIEDPLLPYPPLAGLFLSLIDLADLQEIQSLKDQASIYKLLVARLETINGSDDVDDWAVDIDTALLYFKKLRESLPDWVSAALSPVPIEVLDIYRDETDDVNHIADATENLFANSGGQVLYTAGISTSSGLENSLIADTNYGLSSVIPQIQNIMNKWLTMKLGDKACSIKFYRVSPYTLKNFKKVVKEDATLGLPNKLLLSSLNSMTEKETLNLNQLEIDVLGLDEKFKPMQTSYTQSSDQDDKDADELSDEGLETRDAGKNDK